MREIKFRGYAVPAMVNGQWRYGFGVSECEFSEEYAERLGRKSDWLLHSNSIPIEVHEKSIGQYVGLQDIEGKDIYEGDIVEYGYCDKSYLVIWEDYRFNLKGFYEGYLDYPTEAFSESLQFKVVGNIHEHPHLLKEERT